MKRHLKIVIAPDSFKGSISARDAADAIAEGLTVEAKGSAELELLTVPIADGGEGTLDALVSPDAMITCRVTGTGNEPIAAQYGYIGETAVIEMARAAGLTLVPEERRCAATATTFGVGELIKDALDKGFRTLILTVGGSGTNDGGCGMLAALGARFWDCDKKSFIPTGGTLDRIDRIDLTELDPRLGKTRFLIATDVKNPLCGPYGATRIYARQKGADDVSLDQMESGMLHYATLLKTLCGRDVSVVEGCGAGGGLAAPLLAFCNAEIRSGIDAVLESVAFEEKLKDADAVITGEGKIDLQSLYGKAISGVANAARAQGIPIYCFVGCVGDDPKQLKALGISEIYTLSEIAPSPEYSMKHADLLLKQLAGRFFSSFLAQA